MHLFCVVIPVDRYTNQWMDELFILAVYDWCLFILMFVPSVFKLNAVLHPITLSLCLYLTLSLSFQNCECHRGLRFETGDINVFFSFETYI